MNEIVYLNGLFLDKKEASISPDDRGFIFADGVYEVIKYYNGKPFRYDDHIERLKRSLAEISIFGFDIDSLKEIFDKLLSENDLINTHAGIYLQITRGVYKRIHHFPKDTSPSVYAFAFAFPSFTENLQKGIKVTTNKDIRWLRCDIKSVSLLANTMIFNSAVEAGAKECILIRDGLVTEATHSSVLGIKNGKVITHPLSNLILPGVTRRVINEICNELNFPFEERAFSETELFEMDELIIAGTGSEITPVVQINQSIIGNGIPGEITKLLQIKFFEMV